MSKAVPQFVSECVTKQIFVQWADDNAFGDIDDADLFRSRESADDFSLRSGNAEDDVFASSPTEIAALAAEKTVVDSLAHVWTELLSLRCAPDEMRAWELASNLDDLAWALPRKAAHLRAASVILRNNTAVRATAPLAFNLAAHLVERAGTSTPPGYLVDELRVAAQALASAVQRGGDFDIEKRHLAFCVAEL